MQQDQVRSAARLDIVDGMAVHLDELALGGIGLFRRGDAF